MENKKKKFYENKSFWTTDLMVILLFVIGGYFIYQGLGFGSSEDDPCREKTIAGMMRSPLMKGVLEKGSSYRVDLNFYKCNSVELNDVVAFEISGDLGMIVKTVKAIPGQVLQVVKNEEKKAWSVLADGEYLLQSNGEPIYFGVARVKPPIAKYLEDLKGILPSDRYLLFSEVSPGINDSGVLGAISKKKILGKIYFETL